MEDSKFTLIDEKGIEVTYDILFTFESEETNKNYIAYTDNTKDKDGNVQVYASIYHPEEKNARLEEIKTEKEWKIIETILSTIQEEIKDSNNNEQNN